MGVFAGSGITIMADSNIVSENQNDTEVNPFAAMDSLYSESLKTAIGNAGDAAPGAAILQEQATALSPGPGLNRFIMEFKQDCSYQQIYNLIKDYSFEVIGSSSNRVFSIQSQDDLNTIKAKLDEYCVYIEIDFVLNDGENAAGSLSLEENTTNSELFATPNDTYLSSQWYLSALNVTAAWDYTTGTDSTYVAVIDSGIDRYQPDLMNSDIRNGLDVIRGGTVEFDVTGHGTNVTGVIAATMNNYEGIAGIAPDAAIIPYCVEDDSGGILSSDIASALYAAADIPCKVINISLGGNYTSTVQNAITYAYGKGCIIVAAAGNDGTGAYSYPASCDGVISVGSTGESSARSYFSNYNNMLDVMAPGEYIYTTNRTDASSYYGSHSGTSFSSPCVAGIAALAVSCDPEISPLEFAQVLAETSTDLGSAGYDVYYGSGLVNAASLLERIVTRPIVTYRTHVQDIGWQDYVRNGEVSGTTGQSKRLEAINIMLINVAGGIEYKTHVQDIGWQDWVADGAISGTSGQSKRLEAIQIRLTGTAADLYDVYYCVHAQNNGWLDWAKNGEPAGTAGYGYRLEAIKILLVTKGGAAPGAVTRPFVDLYAPKPIVDTVSYQTHVQDIGWQDYVSNGAVSGTSGQSLRLEAIRIKLENMAGGIEYRTHVQDIGWLDWVADDALSGTSGQSKRLEAIQIQLTGAAAEVYDVYYCVHAQNFGWLDWAKNGEPAGTAGYSYRLEAIEIVLIPKGGAAPGSIVRPFVQG